MIDQTPAEKYRGLTRLEMEVKLAEAEKERDYCRILSSNAGSLGHILLNGLRRIRDVKIEVSKSPLAIVGDFKTMALVALAEYDKRRAGYDAATKDTLQEKP